MTTLATSRTAAVAQELLELLRAGRTMDAIDRFYSPDIVSVEPVSTADLPAVLTGIEAIRGKNQWWLENNEIHGATAHGPYLGDDQFAVHYEWDTTFKPTGRRAKMAEMALYTVKDDKIVREEFFYHLPAEQ